MTKNTMSFDRRSFVKGAAVAAGAAAVAGTVAVASADEAESPKPSFMIAPEAIADDAIAETVEADVVIIGCGSSALETALSALREGLNVVMFSRSEHPISRGGSNCAVYSKKMEEMGLPRMDCGQFVRSQLAQASYNVNSATWYRWINGSEESMNWLIDEISAVEGMRVSFEAVSTYPSDPTDPAYAPNITHSFNNDDYPIVGNGQQSLVEALAGLVLEAGGRIDYKVQACQLVRGGVANGTEGRVEAAIGQREDGTFVKYAAKKAVVLATGDFSGDREMMEAYAPHAVKYVTNWDYCESNPDDGLNFGGLYTGQGHKMGLWVGAAWQHTWPNAIMVTEEFGTAVSGQCYCSHTGLMIDADGNRFCAEPIPYSYLAELQEHLKGGRCYAIMDCNFPSSRPSWMNRGKAVGDPDEWLDQDAVLADWDGRVEMGSMWKADTLEELVEQMGLPVENTLATIEKYNGFVEAGEDPEFYKDPSLLAPIATPPFYGWKSNQPRFLTVLGGLRTNANMQVCDENDEPIEGLYNVGTMIGDFFSNYYTFQVAGHNYGACCLTMGYLTGKYIAANE